MKERIHIFIPVYYREKTVRLAIEAMLQTYKSPGYDVKLILVDNRSDDSLRSFLKEVKEQNEDVKLMLLDRNEGKSKAIMMATEKHSNFQWFINCDSDIRPITEGWPGLLVESYRQIPRAGMVSVNYIDNGNAPMPKQPERMDFEIDGKPFVFHYGGQVAGGCFVTDKMVWQNVGYKRSGGVYGGVDGLFRLSVAESLERRCGFIESVLVEHLDDRCENRGYHRWKIGVQRQIKRLSPLAKPRELGNEKGYWDK